MSCDNLRNPDFCPTFDEVYAQTIALLPRGRAWGTNLGGALGPVMAGFWQAVAAWRLYAEERLCALKLEWSCSTMSETLDLWEADYGLPDNCDPWNDVCTKVAAIGGGDCAYYTAIAAQAGWSITCITRSSQCGTSAGFGRAGRARTGSRMSAGKLIIQVNQGGSRAYKGSIGVVPYAGRIKAGQRLGCTPDISALKCILARVLPAHIQVTYEVVS